MNDLTNGHKMMFLQHKTQISLVPNISVRSFILVGRIIDIVDPVYINQRKYAMCEKFR